MVVNLNLQVWNFKVIFHRSWFTKTNYTYKYSKLFESNWKGLSYIIQNSFGMDFKVDKDFTVSLDINTNYMAGKVKNSKVDLSNTNEDTTFKFKTFNLSPSVGTTIFF